METYIHLEIRAETLEKLDEALTELGIDADRLPTYAAYTVHQPAMGPQVPGYYYLQLKRQP